MKILILTTQDRFFLSHLRERASYFQRQGNQVYVLAQKTENILGKTIESYGFTFFDTKIERASTNPLIEYVSVSRLFKIYQSIKPDVAWHLGAKAIIYGTYVAHQLDKNIGIVNAPIGLGYVFASNEAKAKLLQPILLSLYKKFLNPPNSRVIIENFDDINFFIKQGALKPQYAHCILGAGVDTTEFRYCNEKNSICTVIFAARLIKEKGVWDFVQAARILYEMKTPVRMQLVGVPDYGNPSSLTSEEFEQLKQDPAIEVLGFREDMSALFKRAHICCLPSFYREGLPRVLVEATSSGLVILTTDTVGCREAIRDKNGFLFKPHDVKAMVSSILYLINNEAERIEMAKRSRKVALMYFDTKEICKRTYEILKMVAKKNN